MPALPSRKIATPSPGPRLPRHGLPVPLKAHRFVPGFLVDTLRIRRQLARTEGLVAYALNV